MNKLTKTLLGAGALALFFKVPALRRNTLSKGVMKAMDKLGFLPTISETEKTAIEAGTVWMDGELFSGKPDFDRINSQPYPDLRPEEKEFMEGPVEELCRMTDDWQVYQEKDLSEEVWSYLKEKRFFGMIIPEEYGGLGFSPLANSTVVQKLATRSIPLSITVMVPNSLGPAELLIHYGTEEQKEYYLPRLATGEEIPAFALTEPSAGSDAGAMQARGEVFKGDDGKLYLRLNWKKRYITLASVSTVLGLAFKLYDPDNLLGQGEELGITCALIPTDTEGVEAERRHDPMSTPFYNSPTEGRDVVVPIDAIIGGAEQAGNGWRMLMESLSAGRGISLPAQSTGGAKYVSRVASAHATVRQQFGLPIGKFEGIEEPLARMGGFTYLMDAARIYTCGGLMQGAKPAVVSAIVKYNTTELQRQLINDGMDVLGGNGISRGPSNLLARAYIAMPISITVEGANILTRTLMIFGQGAIRCHPYAYNEIVALEDGDLAAFDEAFAGHVEHVIGNAFRSLGLSLTRGRLERAPVDGPAAPYYRKLAWASASFALLADLVMASLGGALKRKEKITGRFADVFSWMYLAAATLRRFEAEGRRKEDEPFMHWALQYSLAQMQEAFDGIYENVEIPGLTWFFRGPVAWWSRINPLSAQPSDRLGGTIAESLQTAGAQRDRLTEGVYLPAEGEEPLYRLEEAFRRTLASYDIVRKLRDAVKAGQLEKGSDPFAFIKRAREKGILTLEEADQAQEAEEARNDYIQVDSFSMEEYEGLLPSLGEQTGGNGAPTGAASTSPQSG